LHPRAQAYGLVNPSYGIGGVLTGTASDYWNVLWPGASNGAAVGFLVSSRTAADLRPRTVRCCHGAAWGMLTEHKQRARPQR
jgi:hypothetical protein